MQHTTIIAEIGECYNGDMQTAYRLMDEAKAAGCDIVKFQTLDSENIDDNDPERDWFYKIAMDSGRVRELVEYARKIGIEILFTPQDERTAGWLLENGLTSVKIPSNSVGAWKFAEFLSNNFKKIFVSTGMSGLDEIVKMVSILEKADELYILHCVSEYPTGPLLDKNGLTALRHENVSLNMMLMLKSLFPMHKVGYSDHTDGILAPIVAASMGAEVIEKHITLDRETPLNHFRNGLEYMGTDHLLSLEPEELRKMVAAIRETEIIKGGWEWKRSEGEIILREFIRGRFR